LRALLLPGPIVRFASGSLIATAGPDRESSHPDAYLRLQPYRAAGGQCTFGDYCPEKCLFSDGY
jgi:hypothetical protein